MRKMRPIKIVGHNNGVERFLGIGSGLSFQISAFQSEAGRADERFEMRNIYVHRGDVKTAQEAETRMPTFSAGHVEHFFMGRQFINKPKHPCRRQRHTVFRIATDRHFQRAPTKNHKTRLMIHWPNIRKGRTKNDRPPPTISTRRIMKPYGSILSKAIPA